MAGVVVLALVVPLPATSTLLALVVIALVAGLELRVDVPVPPIVAALIAAAVVVSGDAILSAAVVVAIVATDHRVDHGSGDQLLGAGACRRRRPRGCRRVRPAPVTAAALVVALVFELSDRGGPVTGRLDGAVRVCRGGAGRRLAFPRHHRSAAVFGVGLAAVFVAAAACGAPPWGSRVVGRWVVRHRSAVRSGRLSRPSPLCSFSCAITACALGSPEALVAVGVGDGCRGRRDGNVRGRQWRFSLAGCGHAHATLALAAVVSCRARLPSRSRATAQPGRWAPRSVAGVCTSIAWPLVRLAALGDAGTRRRRRAGGADPIAPRSVSAHARQAKRLGVEGDQWPRAWPACRSLGACLRRSP